MNCGRFCERLFPMRFFSSTPQSNQETFFRNKILIPLCLSYENCKRPRRSHIPKHENCNILVCNFHISLQFSLSVVWFLRGRLQFSYGFAIFIWVCNFHISLQFSRHNSRTLTLTYAALYWFPCNYELELITPRQPQFSVEETKKNES